MHALHTGPCILSLTHMHYSSKITLAYAINVESEDVSVLTVLIKFSVHSSLVQCHC